MTEYKGVVCYERGNVRLFHHNLVSIDKFRDDYTEQYFRGKINNLMELQIVLEQIG